jgi:hypothetical protein
MLWGPADSVAALIWAAPLFKGTAAPKLAPSIWNWTAPVGVPDAALTAAVKMMD